MSDRLTVNNITSDDLDALYDERDRLAEFAADLYVLLYGSEAVADGQD